MRTMYDSVNPAAIPRGALLVAGYLAPSRYEWSKNEWNMFPLARKIRIAITATTNDGHVLDVEPGDADPSEAPGWVRCRRAAGFPYPVVYCNHSTWPAVRREFLRQKVAPPLYWIAKYDGVAQLIPGAIAKQYADPGVHNTGHFDLSVAADYWPGIDPPQSTQAKVKNDMNYNDPWDEAKLTTLGPARLGHALLNIKQNSDAARDIAEDSADRLARVESKVDKLIALLASK